VSDDAALWFGSIAELGARYRAGELSPVAVTGAFLERIRRLDGRLHAFITVADAQAMVDAGTAESRLRRGDPSPLLGIPLAVKDNIATRGIRTTGNSRVLEDWIPDSDAVVVDRLRAAGAVILGKTNLNELGWSIPSDDDLCPPARNPWNPEYAAIGSSSGSGAAVAAGMVVAALGTDGGGSVRLPAGQMGLIGVKPTHGAVSSAGSLSAGSTIGDIGILARCVDDARIVTGALLAHEASPIGDGAARPGRDRIDGVRVGVPRRFIDQVPVEREVAEAFEAALTVLRRLGAVVTDVDPTGLAAARTANFVSLIAEHYAAHETFLPRHWTRYGRSARLYLAHGAFLSAADYLAARETGRVVRAEIDRILEEVELIATPVSPVVTAEAARRPGAHRRGVNASFTAPFNLTGHPGVSVPCGIGETGLPIGFQLVGRYHAEAAVLDVARAYEQTTEWHRLRPQLDARGRRS